MIVFALFHLISILLFLGMTLLGHKHLGEIEVMWMGPAEVSVMLKSFGENAA